MTDIPKVALLLETSRIYGRELLRGIVRFTRLHERWTLEFSPGHFQQQLPKMQREGVQGIIARISSPELAQAIRAEGVPAIALEASFEEFATVNPKLGLCEIRSQSEAIGRMAAEHLLERGFREFAYCGIPQCLWSQVREQAFVRRVAESGFLCHVYAMSLSRRRKQWERERPLLRSWLSELPKPIGLMACNDDRGRKVLIACRDAQVVVPDEVGVVGVDNDDLVCDLCDPPLSSVALDLQSAGYAAAKLLSEMMAGQTHGYFEVPITPLWVASRLSTDVIAQEDRVLAAALRFIRDSATRPIGVSDVVKQTGLSRRSLERRFQSGIGHTILDEITRCRLVRAKRLLLETELTVEAVAAAAGFSGLKPLVRAFRANEDLSPAEFRRKHIC
jgi:LacI family transcriptional regulator